jgi:hypothetical protein
MAIETAGITAMGASAVSTSWAVAFTSADFQQSAIVGGVTGVVFFIKEYAHHEEETTLFRVISEFLYTIPMTISLSLIIAYAFTAMSGQYDIVESFWGIPISILIGLNYKFVLSSISSPLKKIVNIAIDTIQIIANKYGGKK